MTDRTRTRLSFLLYASMFVLPGTTFAIGWIGWDLRAGAVAALVTFAICFLLAGILLATVTDLSWIAVWAPFALGMTYAVLPDFVPTPFDDAAVATAGALMTFALWVKKQPDTPKWIVFPLLVSGLYTLVGGFIASPVDELLISAIGFGSTTLGARRQLPARGAPVVVEAREFVTGDYAVEEE